MATINISAVWNEDQQRYIPAKFELTGDGPISVTKALVEDGGEWIHKDGDCLTFGPFLLHIFAEDPSKEIYWCNVVTRCPEGRR